MQNLYQLKPGYMVENIAGQNILIAPAIGDIDYSRMIVLSQSAAFIIQKLISQPYTFDSLLKLLLDEYDIDESTVKVELKALLSELDHLNIFE